MTADTTPKQLRFVRVPEAGRAAYEERRRKLAYLTEPRGIRAAISRSTTIAPAQISNILVGRRQSPPTLDAVAEFLDLHNIKTYLDAVRFSIRLHSQRVI